MAKSKDLSAKQRDALLSTLESRFTAHAERHTGLKWPDVAARLKSSSRLWSLEQLEASGGEPDVVRLSKASKELVFVDCSAQSPKDRRSVCFDREARVGRKEHPPKSSALEMAAAMGAELLTPEEYQALQELGEFDTTTSSWVQTPARIRKLGGALYCDRRYDTVFLYHNGADSYYAARGFRCALRI